MSRGSKRSNMPRAMKSELGMLKSSLHGHANKLTQVDPPAYNAKPWNSIVVNRDLAASATTPGTAITIGELVGSLIKQLDLPASTSNLCVKIKRLDIWNVPIYAADTPKVFVKTKFYSIHAMHGLAGSSAGAQFPMAVLEDIGMTGAKSAVVSYTWPRDQQDISLGVLSAGSTVNEIQLANYMSSVNGNAVARFHLFWNTGIDYTV